VWSFLLSFQSLLNTQFLALFITICNRSVKFRYYARQEMYSGLLGFWTLSIVQQFKEHNVSETLLTFILR
jgi:hypothetical protein